MSPRASRPPKRQRGVSLVTAAFLIAGLATLGALMVRLTVFGSQESLVDWHASQALYAADSGLDWAMHRITFTSSPPDCDDGDGSDLVVVAGRAWVSVAAEDVGLPGLTLCRLVGTGKAGGSSAAPLATRAIEVTFEP